MDKVFIPYKQYPKSYLNQAPQYKKVEFVSVREEDNKLIAMHPPAFCRDYLGDILYSTKMGKTQAAVYGLSWLKDRDGLLQLDRTKLVLIFNKKTKDKQTLFKNINILWELEHKLGLKTTELTELDEETIYVRGSKRWLENNFVYSFYTFMLRALCYEQIKTPEDWYKELDKLSQDSNTSCYASEVQYIHQITVPKFEKLLKNLKKFFIPLVDTTGYGMPNLSIMTVHSSSGFVSICQNGQYLAKDNPLILLSKKLFWEGNEDNTYNPIDDEDWENDDNDEDDEGWGSPDPEP